MRILLTGGSGYLGCVLSRQLENKGDTLLRLDVRPPADSQGTYLEGSILDFPTLEKSLSDVDCLVHMAAWHGIHEFRGQKNVFEFWDLNVTGTFYAFEATARAGIRRIIYISSTSVDEPNSIYGHTKVLG
ncbi:MAG: NAD(P)-dependent oxidoreductase [Anaerolineae bacterium]|nr:NAD(P)-dependent oxidoreductase [Anaerolineae bacterium]